jgi:hypothetical protein
MLTYNGAPIRRLLYLWPNNSGEAVYLVETYEPRRTCHVPLGRIGADGGVEEVLETARFKGGQILEV